MKIFIFALIVTFLVGGPIIWAAGEPSIGKPLTVVNVIIVSALIISLKISSIKQKHTDMVLSLSEIDNLTGYDFEYYIAWLLCQVGYDNATPTKKSGDFGVDIVATKNNTRISVQTKRQQSKVSRKAISDAVAGMKYYGCQKSMVVTNNYFSKSAIAFGARVNCILINRDALIKWIKFTEKEIGLVRPPSPKIQDFNFDTPLIKAIAIETKNEYPDDKFFQQYIIEERYNGLSAIRDFSDPRIDPDILNIIKSTVASKWGNSFFECQISDIKSQCDAYLGLKKLTPLSDNPRLFIEIVSAAKLNYPDDFVQQLRYITEEVNIYSKFLSLCKNPIFDSDYSEVFDYFLQKADRSYYRAYSSIQDSINAENRSEKLRRKCMAHIWGKDLLSEAESRYPIDYEMKYVFICQQLQNYKDIARQFGFNSLGKDTIDVLHNNSERNAPWDICLRYDVLRKECLARKKMLEKFEENFPENIKNQFLVLVKNAHPNSFQDQRRMMTSLLRKFRAKNL